LSDDLPGDAFFVSPRRVRPPERQPCCALEAERVTGREDLLPQDVVRRDWLARPGREDQLIRFGASRTRLPISDKLDRPVRERNLPYASLRLRRVEGAFVHGLS